MAFERRSHEKNREAEESHTRRQVWGWEGDNGEDMREGDVHFGDVHNASPLLPMALMFLSSMVGIGGLGVAGAAYLFSDRGKTPPANTSLDETVKIGLGRLDDIKDFAR